MIGAKIPRQSSPRKSNAPIISVLKLFTGTDSPDLPDLTVFFREFPLPIVDRAKLAAVSENVQQPSLTILEILEPVAFLFEFDPRQLAYYVSQIRQSCDLVALSLAISWLATPNIDPFASCFETLMAGIVRSADAIPAAIYNFCVRSVFSRYVTAFRVAPSLDLCRQFLRQGETDFFDVISEIYAVAKDDETRSHLANLMIELIEGPPDWAAGGRRLCSYRLYRR
jgi:hypothetical protein